MDLWRRYWEHCRQDYDKAGKTGAKAALQKLRAVFNEAWAVFRYDPQQVGLIMIVCDLILTHQ